MGLNGPGHTECFTSPALSPTASLAALARVPRDASSSFATSVMCVSRRVPEETDEVIDDVRLFPSLLTWSLVP